MATVVLVGRPNTGKSTLFNRLVGGRVAITMREPGITRDRIIRDAEWTGRRFQVIDTGGLDFAAADEIGKGINRQVEIALAEADMVVLVVDGREGLTALDEEVAARLRRRSLRFLLAVNKLDATTGFDEAEFHRLGALGLFALSAEHGLGIGSLLDELVKHLPPDPVCRRRQAVSLAVLGRPNVGKSSFLNALVGSERALVTPIPGTTRDVIEAGFDLDDRHFRILDTAGIRRKARVTEAVEYFSVTRALDVIERSDVVLLIIDVTEGPTAQDKKIANLIEDRNRGLVVVANKTDLVKPGIEERVREYVARELAFISWSPVAYTSCLKGEGIADAVRTAGRVYEAGGRHVSSALLRAGLLDRLAARPPRRDCRLLGLNQTGTRPPRFRIRASDPDALDPNYRKSVVSGLRRFGFEGWPIRLIVGR
ncbi:MAG: ribosome biogenesis GTPase Der [bacterium]